MGLMKIPTYASGGSSELQQKIGTLSANQTLLAENIGNATKFVWVNTTGSKATVLTNINPTTGETETNQSYKYDTSTNTWTLDTQWYFVVSGRNVSLNYRWSSSQAYNYVLFYE